MLLKYITNPSFNVTKENNNQIKKTSSPHWQHMINIKQILQSEKTQPNTEIIM